MIETVVIFVSKNDRLREEVAKGLANKFQGIDIVTVVAKRLENIERHLENLRPLTARGSRVIVFNTNCADPLSKTLSISQVVNFCLCPHSKSERHSVTIKPYISLAEILATRIKSLSTVTRRLGVSISVPEKDLGLMAQLHNLTPDQVLQLSMEYLKTMGVAWGQMLPANNAVTTISVEWQGLIRGYRKEHMVRLKLEYSPDQGFSGYTWQILALISLFVSGAISPVEVADVVPALGSNEGLYAYLISKLVEYGGEYKVDIG